MHVYLYFPNNIFIEMHRKNCILIILKMKEKMYTSLHYVLAYTTL